MGRYATRRKSNKNPAASSSAASSGSSGIGNLSAKVSTSLPFSIQFVSPRTVRIRVRTGPQVKAEEPSLLVVGEPPRDNLWRMARISGGYRYTSAAGSVTILENPSRLLASRARIGLPSIRSCRSVRSARAPRPCSSLVAHPHRAPRVLPQTAAGRQAPDLGERQWRSSAWLSCLRAQHR